MPKRFIRKISPFLAILLLAPWPITYAQSYSGNITRQDAVQIEVSEASVAPSWTAYGKAIGGVTPGDLFYIDATDNATDIVVALYITNAQQLSHCYRNLILKVGVYVESNADEWEKASWWDGEPISDTFITLRNGQVSFTLQGYANYKVTIDSGSFYCIATNADGGSTSPHFFLEVE